MAHERGCLWEIISPLRYRVPAAASGQGSPWGAGSSTTLPKSPHEAGEHPEQSRTLGSPAAHGLDPGPFAASIVARALAPSGPYPASSGPCFVLEVEVLIAILGDGPTLAHHPGARIFGPPVRVFEDDAPEDAAVLVPTRAADPHTPSGPQHARGDVAGECLRCRGPGIVAAPPCIRGGLADLGCVEAGEADRPEAAHAHGVRIDDRGARHRIAPVERFGI